MGRKMGTQCWIFIAVNIMELLVNLKFGFHTFTQTDMNKIALWMFGVMVVCAVLLYIMAAWSELQQFLETDKRHSSGEQTNPKHNNNKKSSRNNENSDESNCSSDHEGAHGTVFAGARTRFFFRRNYR